MKYVLRMVVALVALAGCTPSSPGGPSDAGGTDAACGGSGQMCCIVMGASHCGPGLTCSESFCVPAGPDSCRLDPTSPDSCPTGMTCVSNTSDIHVGACAPCGGASQPCCEMPPSRQPSICDTGLTCDFAGRCGGGGDAGSADGDAAIPSGDAGSADGGATCGGHGQPCCDGLACGANLVCTVDTMTCDCLAGTADGGDCAPVDGG